ncbi:hypothetical protein HOI83_02250 [Candidatus Uhrbacteria bacterium]|jgi:hypothetical protein|nr:hypothetical protein [Candidatus Uhrbacteria bacterium]
MSYGKLLLATLFTFGMFGCLPDVNEGSTHFHEGDTVVNEGDTYVTVNNGDDDDSALSDDDDSAQADDDDSALSDDDDDSASEPVEETCDFEFELSDISPYAATCSGDFQQSATVAHGDIYRATSLDMIYVQNEDLRHVIPHGTVLESWYGEEACPFCEDVNMVPDVTVASISLGRNVTVKPGSKIVVIGSDTQLFLVDECRTLRSTTPAVARDIYGNDWNQMISIVPDMFFTEYVIGTQVTEAWEYDLMNAEAQTLSDELTCGTQPEPQGWVNLSSYHHNNMEEAGEEDALFRYVYLESSTVPCIEELSFIGFGDLDGDFTQIEGDVQMQDLVASCNLFIGDGVPMDEDNDQTLGPFGISADGLLVIEDGFCFEESLSNPGMGYASFLLRCELTDTGPLDGNPDILAFDLYTQSLEAFDPVTGDDVAVYDLGVSDHTGGDTDGITVAVAP